MTETFDLSNASPELQSLIGFLGSDPSNLMLLSDVVERAVSEGQSDLAENILTRYANLEGRSDGETGSIGLIAMKSRDFERAVNVFEKLIEEGSDDPALKFNLAWSLSMLGQHEKALTLVNEDSAKALPQAAMLEVQLMHQLGRFEIAGEKGREYLNLHPDDTGLNAAISVLAMDIEDRELAMLCAQKGGDHPDALTTLGTLALGDNENDAAMALFDRALTINPHGPRTWIGKGLAQLSSGDPQSATENIDRGAEMFGTHLGSWIASGWAYFILDDKKTSRQRFEHALAIDDTFAEIHGSLAVLDVLEGNTELAQQRSKTALRLDKECFSAALAQTLLVSASGKPEVAQKIFDRAIYTPIDAEGRTLFDSLTRMGLST